MILSDKLLSLIRKLQALADQGVGGEKENAIQLLQALMTKHNITTEMLEGIEKKTHEYFLRPEEEQFFHQICSSVLGGDSYSIHQYSYKLKRQPGKQRYCIKNVTDAEFIEIMAKHDFYYAHYLKEERLFYKAFIQKNHLYRKPDNEDDDAGEEKVLSAKEKAELFKMAQMMQGMERKVFIKQLEQ